MRASPQRRPVLDREFQAAPQLSSSGLSRGPNLQHTPEHGAHAASRLDLHPCEPAASTSAAAQFEGWILCLKPRMKGRSVADRLNQRQWHRGARALIARASMKKAYLLAVNVNDGSSQSKTWEPEQPMKSIIPTLGFGNQTSEMIASIPKNQALVIDRLIKGRVPDVLGNLAGPFVVSPAIRDYLDEHEPGVHAFLPIEIRTRTRAQGETAHHWLLLAPPMIDCLDIVNSVMINDVQGRPWDRVKSGNGDWGGGISTIESNRCVFVGDEIGGRQLWRVQVSCDRLSATYACSAAFWSFFKANKMRGWTAEKACEVR